MVISHAVNVARCSWSALQHRLDGHWDRIQKLPVFPSCKYETSPVEDKNTTKIVIWMQAYDLDGWPLVNGSCHLNDSLATYSEQMISNVFLLFCEWSALSQTSSSNDKIHWKWPPNQIICMFRWIAIENAMNFCWFNKCTDFYTPNENRPNRPLCLFCWCHHRMYYI